MFNIVGIVSFISSYCHTFSEMMLFILPKCVLLLCLTIADKFFSMPLDHNASFDIPLLAACMGTKCGKHQWCTIKDGKPECVCHLNCHKEKFSPVCGMSNGKEYMNRCLLRKDECDLQKEIGTVPGPCRSKTFI